MKSQPPVLATWLLEHLGSDPRNEQIVGDLLEHYAGGRSRAWYWRQVTMAILVGFFEELNSHKLLALRALVVGWLAWFLLREISITALKAAVNPWSMQLPSLAALVWWTGWLFNCAVTGWIVGRFHRTSRVAVVPLFAFTVFLWREQVVQWPLRVDAPWLLHGGINAWRDSRYLPAFAHELVAIGLGTLCILLGGFCAAPSKVSRPNPAAAAR